MITYNHEQYISQALESVLMQKVNFDYEIVIGDDLSQDKTREILVRYQESYPNRIRLLFYDTNMGPGGNLYRVLNSCESTYIALLEGDDFWTSPSKLQTQVDFLDAHTEYALSCHPVTAFSQATGEIGRVISKLNGSRYTLDDLLQRRIFPVTGSVVYRNVFKLPIWISKLRYCDYALWVLITHYGLIKFHNEYMGCYREHNQGVWSGESAINRVIHDIVEFEAINMHYDYRYENYLNLRSLYGSLARAYREAGQLREATKYFRYFLKSPHGGVVTIEMYLRTTLAVYFPWTVRIGRRLRAHRQRIRLANSSFVKS